MKATIIGLVALVVMMIMAPASTQQEPLDDRVADLETRVAYLETFHPVDTQTLVIAEDTTYTQPLILRPGDSVEFRNGARLSFGPGGYLDTQGTPTDTWSETSGVITKNLDRDIRLFGAGDIMFMPGSLPSTITFTEFDLQPDVAVDHYPLHWHKAGTSPAGTIVEGVVVKNSTNRCIVPHGVTGITIRDTICNNITNTAIWWNPPTPPAGATVEEQRAWDEDDGNNIILDHVLVDGVNVPEGNNGYRNFAFQLQCGSGNVIRHSLAANIAGKSQSGGYYWASQCNLHENGAVWTFENNATVSALNCAVTWQNSSGRHDMNGIRCFDTTSFLYGAYSMTTHWSGIESNGVQHVITAVNTHIKDSELDVVVFSKPKKLGVVTITDSPMERMVFQPSNKSGKGHLITITNSDVGCGDWSGTPDAATTLTVDGVECDLP